MDEGIYEAEVVETRFGVSGIKKSPRLEVLFQIEAQGNESIWGHIYFTNKGMARKSIKAIGFDIDNKGLEELRDNNHLLTGQKCEVEIEDDSQYGLKVKWINKIGGDASLNLKELTKELRDVKKKGKSGPASEPAGDPPPTEPAEDIPF